MSERSPTGMQPITPDLRRWLREQLGAGHDATAVLAAMQRSGWDKSVAMVALAQALADDGLGEPMAQADPGQRLPELALLDTSELWVHDRRVKVLVQMHHPRVVVLGDFLSDEECTGLMALAAPRLTRSQTVANATGGSEVNKARTSQGMFFSRNECELCSRIETRISALLNWPVENGEGLQVLCYPAQAQYQPHFDYFDPAQPGSAAILARGGQRVGTLVMYLNTPKSGGGTTFPDVGLTVQAIAGQAVFFSYDRPDPGTKTLHGGAPVLAGDKWVATKWLRAHRFD
jgi:prolyl 4-hydroxylase